MRKSRALAAVMGTVAALGLAMSGQATAQPDIIGGGTVSSAPWGAQIYWDNVSTYNGFECSGTIIAAQWVLTAQHCLNSAGMHVRVGNVNLGQGTLVAVDRKVASTVGDMGLLHLTSPVSTTYMTLASSNPPVGATNQIYGWGRTLNQSPPSSVLKTANVQVTGTSRGANGCAWHGDSGGPELYNGQQVGVCSTGSNSGSNPQGTQNYASVTANRS